MYRIGICDDEKGTCEELEKMVSHFLIFKGKSRNRNFLFWRYFYGLSKSGNWFHLLFLDIELTSSNGIKIGNYIRKNLKDEHDVMYRGWITPKNITS